MARQQDSDRRRLFEELMFGTRRARRFTQDTPILPDVWLAYADCLDEDRPIPRGSEGEAHPPIKLLLTPYRDTAVGEVRHELRTRLTAAEQRSVRQSFGHAPDVVPRVVYNQTTLAAALQFEDLIRCVLPMTDWWQEITETWNVENLGSAIDGFALAVEDPEHSRAISRQDDTVERPAPGLLWMMRVVGALALLLRGEELPWSEVPAPRIGANREPDRGWRAIVEAVADLVRGIETGPETAPQTARIHSVSLNRDVIPTVTKSTLAVKADAARKLFGIDCDKLRWAIVDSGVDARHPAFRATSKKGERYLDPFVVEGGRTGNGTRVVATYDFSRIEDLLDPETLKPQLESDGSDAALLRGRLGELAEAIRRGRNLDWSQIEPLLRIPHENGKYREPGNDHGTHVAGILGADWSKDDSDGGLDADLLGVCPDIRLYDLRVLDADGRGDEFAVMAALQFVRHLNATHDYVVIHGVNLSLSIPHDVANFACGRTPVCDEAERVVAAGVVVVAAAGNQGYRRYWTAENHVAEAYNASSITDPGNAETVITVGATHRYRPHTYGVSYFSSRGPTGDGRAKPDLVAPGEKITSALPDRLFGLKDGTSMAAPHASGAAALLMARHAELVGQPQRIKEILCGTATDLGRERYFQGAGMLDVLRALQSV